ncbi:MAG TPA: TatD family hydrolase, partial [Pirellulales bacterium]|nr:TatD family hydrolase [Pirellulales bacterium]
THCHLDSDDFDRDRPEIIARAIAAGVERMVAIAVTAESSAAVVQLADDNEAVYAAVGIHPNYTAEAKPGDWDRVVALARSPKVVALGETGLDRFRDHAPFDLQQEYFARHIALSQERSLPFVVHMRSCEADVMQMLRDAATRGPLIGVMHSFTGDAAMAAECIALGMYISFAGMVTYKKSDALQAVAATIPADRILVETDSPYLAPEPLRGKRNVPANVVHTAACLAAVRGQSADDFAAVTTANARRLFRLP